MDLLASDLVQPLHHAEGEFLALLLTSFSLVRHGEGVELRVEFDEDTPAIWSRRAKRHIQDMIPRFRTKARAYQRQLDSFLLDGEGPRLDYCDAEFPFRYASGGTLPIVRWGGDEYFCLFHRDVFPIGWNIANGGCDSRYELLHPSETIERELREELIFMDPVRKYRYVFDRDAGKPVDWPEFAVARAFWQTRRPDLEFSDAEELRIPVRWLEGSDSLTARLKGQGRSQSEHTEGLFLNINAEDFGIEVDRVATIELAGDVCICDGEVVGGRLVNEPVGLFRTDRFDPESLSADSEFVPDVVFYDGHPHERRELGPVIRKFLQRVSRFRSPRSIRDYRDCKRKYDLCPATRRIMQRYLRLLSRKPVERSTAIDVFISFGSEDARLAASVNRSLQRHGKSTFFSMEARRDAMWSMEVCRALESADWLVAVATRPKHLLKKWPSFEYHSFHQIMLYQKRERKRGMLSLVSGFDPQLLPLPLATYHAVKVHQRRMSPALAELRSIVT